MDFTLNYSIDHRPVTCTHTLELLCPTTISCHVLSKCADSHVVLLRAFEYVCVCDQVPLQYQQELLDNLDASAASVEEVESSSSTSTIIAQVRCGCLSRHTAALPVKHQHA